MLRSLLLIIAIGSGVLLCDTKSAQAQQGYGRQWSHTYGTQDWNRFYHYPYVYYPQNFYSNDYYRSSESLYYRYPQEMRIPVYNKQWHNMYPEGAMYQQNDNFFRYRGTPGGGKYHSGHHFILDTF